MKSSQTVRKLAKQIFKASVEQETLNETTLLKFVEQLQKKPSGLSRLILQSLVKRVERYEAGQNLVIETPYSLTDELVKAIQTKFENLLEKKLNVIVLENKELIGGVRVTCGDNVWENTIESSLMQLKGRFINV